MDWRGLFNYSVATKPVAVRGVELTAAAAAPAAGAAAPQEAKSGAFITPQTLMSFPVATGLVSIIWQTVGSLFPELKGALWVAFVVSFLVGVFLFYAGISDPKAELTRNEKIISAIVALANVFVLFAASAGIRSMAG